MRQLGKSWTGSGTEELEYVEYRGMESVVSNIFERSTVGDSMALKIC